MTERQLEEVIAEIIQANLRFPGELEALVLSFLTTQELVDGSNLSEIRKEVRFQIKLHELKPQGPAVTN
jgi:hypothetical protein